MIPWLIIPLPSLFLTSVLETVGSIVSVFPSFEEEKEYAVIGQTLNSEAIDSLVSVDKPTNDPSSGLTSDPFCNQGSQTFKQADNPEEIDGIEDASKDKLDFFGSLSEAQDLVGDAAPQIVDDRQLTELCRSDGHTHMAPRILSFCIDKPDGCWIEGFADATIF